MNKTRATFSLVTDEAIRGKFGTLSLNADKLPAMKHGMEQWQLRWGYLPNPGSKRTVKCTPGKGAEEARAILIESAPYWNNQLED